MEELLYQLKSVDSFLRQISPKKDFKELKNSIKILNKYYCLDKILIEICKILIFGQNLDSVSLNYFRQQRSLNDKIDEITLLYLKSLNQEEIHSPCGSVQKYNEYTDLIEEMIINLENVQDLVLQINPQKKSNSEQIFYQNKDILDICHELAYYFTNIYKKNKLIKYITSQLAIASDDLINNEYQKIKENANQVSEMMDNLISLNSFNNQLKNKIKIQINSIVLFLLQNFFCLVEIKNTSGASGIAENNQQNSSPQTQKQVKSYCKKLFYIDMNMKNEGMQYHYRSPQKSQQDDKENRDQNKPIKSILKKSVLDTQTSIKTNEFDEPLSHYNKKSYLLDNEIVTDKSSITTNNTDMNFIRRNSLIPKFNQYSNKSCLLSNCSLKKRII